MKFVGIFETFYHVKMTNPPVGVTRKTSKVIAVDEDGKLFHLCVDLHDGGNVVNNWVQVEESQISPLVTPLADFARAHAHVRNGLKYHAPLRGDWHYADYNIVPDDDWPVTVVEINLVQKSATLKHPSGKISHCNVNDTSLQLYVDPEE